MVDRDDVDVDVHIVAGVIDGSECRGRGHQEATATVGPGTVYVIVDSFVDDDAVAHPGEFLVVIQQASQASGTPAP